MFGFLSPRPPLTTRQRVDLQRRCRHAVDVYGTNFFQSADTLRSIDQLAIPDSDPQSQVDFIVDRLASRFGIAPNQVHFAVVTNPADQKDLFDEFYVYQPSGDDAKLAKPQVLLNQDVAADRVNLVTVVAGGLAHHAWHQRAAKSSDYDSKDISILPILVGLGVLVADASLREYAWTHGGWNGWSMGRLGHFNAMEIGYIMALMTRLRKDADLGWIKNLRLDGRSTAKQTLRYLRSLSPSPPGSELLFDSRNPPSAASSNRDLANWLSGHDPDWAYCAAAIFHDRFTAENVGQAHPPSIAEPSQLIQATLDASRASDPELVVLAAGLLGRLGQRGSKSLMSISRDRLKELTSHKRPAIALAAIDSATRLGLPHQEFLPVAKRLLDQWSFDALPVLQWIKAGGRQCETLAPAVCDVLLDAMQTEYPPFIQAAWDCLQAIVEDPESHLRPRLGNGDQLAKLTTMLKSEAPSEHHSERKTIND